MFTTTKLDMSKSALCVNPCEENGYCLFRPELEDDPLVLFHITPKRNLEGIMAKGFLSGAELGTGELRSVSYAKRSVGCLAKIGNVVDEDSVVFAVRFETLDKDGITVNESDIHVCRRDIQPAILGHCELPSGYRVA